MPAYLCMWYAVDDSAGRGMTENRHVCNLAEWRVNGYEDPSTGVFAHKKKKKYLLYRPAPIYSHIGVKPVPIAFHLCFLFAQGFNKVIVHSARFKHCSVLNAFTPFLLACKQRIVKWKHAKHSLMRQWCTRLGLVEPFRLASQRCDSLIIPPQRHARTLQHRLCDACALHLGVIKQPQILVKILLVVHFVT